MDNGLNKVKKATLKELVRQELCDYINRMDLEKSNKLPREEELCTLLGVSRITIRSVLDELSAEGLISRKQGKGTFVNIRSMNINVSFNPVLHFSDMIRNSGYTPRIQILNYRTEHADPEIADILGLKADEPVVICEKIFFADKKICAYTKDYVPAKLVPEEHFDSLKDYDDSLFRFLEDKCHITIVSDKVEIAVVETTQVPSLCEQLEKEHLQQKPFLLLKGINYDEDEHKIMYGLEYVDTDIIRFNQVRKRNIAKS